MHLNFFQNVKSRCAISFNHFLVIWTAFALILCAWTPRVQARGYWNVSYKVAGYTVAGDHGTASVTPISPQTGFNPGNDWLAGTSFPDANMIFSAGYYSNDNYTWESPISLVNAWSTMGYFQSPWNVVRKINISVTPILTWVPVRVGSIDTVPESAPAYVAVYVYAAARAASPDYNTTSLYADNGWGGERVVEGRGASSVSTHTIVRRVASSGQVHLDTINLRCGYSAAFNTYPLSSPNLGVTRTDVSVTPINLELTANTTNQSFSSNRARDNTEIEAWAQINFYADSNPENPVMPYWYGGANFSLSAKKPANYPRAEDVFTAPNYKWTVTPDPYIPILDPPRQFPPFFNLPVGTIFGPMAGFYFAPTETPENPYDTRLRTLVPQPSEPGKTFHWNFGTDPTYANFPVTTKASIILTESDTATNPDKPISPPLRAKAAIRWHTVWSGAEAVEPPFIAFPAGILVRMADRTWTAADDVLTTKPIQNVAVGDLIYRDGVPADEADWKWTVTSVELLLADGSYKLNLSLYIDPDDACLRGEGEGCTFEESQKKIAYAYKKAIHDGAKGVEYGLTAYKEVAVFMVSTPIEGAAGTLLVAGAVKVETLMVWSAKLRGWLSRVDDVITNIRLMIRKVDDMIAARRARGESVVDLEIQARELRLVEVKLAKGKDDIVEAAAKSDELVDDTLREIGEADAKQSTGWSPGGPAGGGTPNNTPPPYKPWKQGDPPAQLDEAIDIKANSTHPDPRKRAADKLEAEVALAVPREKIVSFDRPIPRLNSTDELTQIDIELTTAIVEVTRNKTKKHDQIIRFLTDLTVNPQGKPVIFYAPDYKNSSWVFLQSELQKRGLTHRLHRVNSRQELLQKIQELDQGML